MVDILKQHFIVCCLTLITIAEIIRNKQIDGSLVLWVLYGIFESIIR